METIAEDYLAELLKLYRVQRHDFLNHFQVAMGYLQLGKTQQALAYLRQVTADVVAAAPLSQVKPPELAVELMLLSSCCFNNGIELVNTVPKVLAEIEWTQANRQAMELIRSLVPGSGKMELILHTSEQSIDLELHFSKLEKSKLEQCIVELESLGIRARGLNNHITWSGLVIRF